MVDVNWLIKLGNVNIKKRTNNNNNNNNNSNNNNNNNNNNVQTISDTCFLKHENAKMSTFNKYL